MLFHLAELDNIQGFLTVHGNPNYAYVGSSETQRQNTASMLPAIA